MLQADVAIVGAGPAGLALAVALARRNCRVVLLERQSEQHVLSPGDDGREIALTHKSVRILESLGAWQRLRDDEIGILQSAQVVDGYAPASLNFETRGCGPLGFIVSNATLRRVLCEVAREHSNIQLHSGCTVTGTRQESDRRVVCCGEGESITAGLVVAADSRYSEVRRMAGIGADMRDFGRVAIVGQVRTERAHDGIARECFRYGSTLALLPLAESHTASAVVTVPASCAETIMQLSDTAFAARVQAESVSQLGGIEACGQRYSYPLVAVYAHRFHAERFALVGDAAVGMHPVTAHGFNLGLAGADTLARQLQGVARLYQPARLGRALSRYQFQHRLESRPIYSGTNRVVDLFTNDRLPAKLLRKAVLRVSNHFPPIRRAIVHQLTR
ncbi:5-demethoxyubiquinol-8 5-hydroxylase UbiM [Microbulbifer sp. 2205BS26-8]|uniref:5-demethoxyubiquinol-8 5-hydroxylase UbiM n=1 Tax=Microbulbifer sp. 2205BS26-8 TaxID=3064386 RepID=UPI00273E9D2A|nr:5-demethoxyubiquinol-8 5-hydroxylase UbiM [Microbulbifer sp. 2205BS26-8]MDP5209130.1 5-demethoxyubiquinol-8 5-hydroxylase UbiM [Microbulbifer sp. 2205BS26-8]